MENNKNSVEFNGEGDYLILPDTEDWKFSKQEKKECYCCHKVKEGKVIIVDLEYIKGKDSDSDITRTELRFVCHSCNHLKPKNNKEE